MKKILAVVVAVAMLATMSVSAVAAPVTADTDVGIIFALWGTSGNDPTPAWGIHNPGVPTAQGAPTNDNWPAWVLPMQNWNLTFGERDFPPLGAVNYRSFGATADALDNTGAQVNSLLGILIQAATDTTTNPMTGLTQDRVVQLQLSNFFVGAQIPANQTLQGFDLDLYATGIPQVGTLNAGISGLLFVAGGTPAGVTQHNLDNIIQGAPSRNAVTVPAGVHGFQWRGNLHGNNTGANFRPGHAQAELTWTFV